MIGSEGHAWGHMPLRWEKRRVSGDLKVRGQRMPDLKEARMKENSGTSQETWENKITQRNDITRKASAEEKT